VQLVVWMFGCSVAQLNVWLFVCLFVCLVGCLVAQLDVWLVGLFVCLFGWLFGCAVGCLVGRFVCLLQNKPIKPTYDDQPTRMVATHALDG